MVLILKSDKMILDNRKMSYQHFTTDIDNNSKLWLIIKPQTYIQYYYTITIMRTQTRCLCIKMYIFNLIIIDYDFVVFDYFIICYICNIIYITCYVFLLNLFMIQLQIVLSNLTTGEKLKLVAANINLSDLHSTFYVYIYIYIYIYILYIYILFSCLLPENCLCFRFLFNTQQYNITFIKINAVKNFITHNFIKHSFYGSYNYVTFICHTCFSLYKINLLISQQLHFLSLILLNFKYNFIFLLFFSYYYIAINIDKCAKWRRVSAAGYSAVLKFSFDIFYFFICFL
ncbi:Odorant receptor 425 [Nylanderia fulva]|uniref:Odorant receptor 425 n=1 Tax=Nylanderia fulva TaxID=613905 RepID=A0A6G1LPU6_9HYME|nr:Odorant receptor 425 [Nylanderia fulva]